MARRGGQGRPSPANGDDDDFFDRKRPWSHIKDTILVEYLGPYLHKVTRAVGERVVLVDGFAGPGRFKDESLGSPLLMLDVADRNTPSECVAVFANVSAEYHQELTSAVQERTGKTPGIPLLWTCGDLLERLAKDFGDRSETLFVYLDPFGVKGCEFAHMEALLRRPKTNSTEFLINLSTPTILRLAGKGESEWATLDSVLDGRWWQAAIGPGGEGAADRVIAGYRQRLERCGFRYTGACPVRDPSNGQLRYHMVFCTRSPVALELMNEKMIEAHDRHLHESWTKGTLFERADWRDWRYPAGLEETVLTAVRAHPGMRRKDLWTEILVTHFMRFRRREFGDELKRLRKAGAIEIRSESGHINDDTLIWLAGAKPAVLWSPTDAGTGPPVNRRAAR